MLGAPEDLMGKVLCVVTLSLVACGTELSEDAGADMAKAFDVKDPHEEAKQTAARMAELKAEAAAEAKAAARAEQDALFVAPDDAPTDMREGCERMTASYDSFMQSRLTGDELERWNAVKVVDLDKVAKSCREGASHRVPACQANAFTHAPPTWDATTVVDILEGCRRKFGGEVAPSP
jgi:hypothetical protein